MLVEIQKEIARLRNGFKNKTKLVKLSTKGLTPPPVSGKQYKTKIDDFKCFKSLFWGGGNLTLLKMTFVPKRNRFGTKHLYLKEICLKLNKNNF